MLAAAPDVHLFSTKDRFSRHRHGTNWLQALLQIFGSGHWCLTVDADEMLIFPGSETLNLRDLCQFMEREGAAALFAVMIDTYPGGLGTDRPYRAGEPFLMAADHFDLGPYYVSIRPRHAFPPIKVRGGFQHRLLQRHRAGRSRGPLLKKLPFVKWPPGGFYGTSAHSITPASPLSGVTGALLHFKFLPPDDLDPRGGLVVSGRSADENRRISSLREILGSGALTDLRSENSIAYRDSGQLAKLGFLHCSSDFAAFAGERLAGQAQLAESRPLQDTLRAAAAHPRGLAAFR
jgi:hypothetical protein